MIIRRDRWLMIAVLFVVGPLMGAMVGWAAGNYLSATDTAWEGAVVETVEDVETSEESTSPMLSLPFGEAVALDEIAPGRKVAVVVMKDVRCPVCQRQLREVSERIDEVQRRGGVVVGLSDAPDCANRSVMHRLELGFPVLSDRNHDLLKKVGMTAPGRDHVMPGVILVDEQGEITEVHKGRSPGQQQTSLILDGLR